MRSFFTVLAFVLLAPVTLYSAFVFSTLWLWFVVPLGVVEIGVFHAWGLNILISFSAKNIFGLTTIEHGPNKIEDSLHRSYVGLILWCFATSVAWGAGAIAASFM